MSEENIIEITNVNNAYHFVASCHPFKLRKATLTVNGNDPRDVYVSFLRGTDASWDKADPLGMPVCLKSACAKDNIFYSLVKNAILDNVPAGSDLMFIGHSLGGMVCQQLGADETLRTKYNVLSVMTMGSPYVVGKGKLCPLKRFADRADFIPSTCSAVLFANIFIGNVVHEYGGHFGHVVKSHCDSYEFSEVWAKYDCFGIANGGHKIVLTDSGVDNVQI